VEVFFTCFFSAEVLLNLVAHWLMPFISDVTNLFDFLIVVSSIHQLDWPYLSPPSPTLTS